MANVYLAAQSNKPGSSLVVLVDTEPSTTGYRYMDFDVGNAAWDKQYSGPRGTQGARLAGATAQNRLATWTLEVVGSSQDNLHALLSTLWQLDDEIRRYGGTITWRPQGGSYRMYLEALDSGVAIVAFDRLYVHNNRVRVNFGVVAPPFFEGPPMDIFDDFSVDSEANYGFDAGSPTDVAVSAGTLTASANLTAEKRLIHTDRGYAYGDHQVTLKFTPGVTITNFKAGVVLKRIDASNYVEVYVDDNGTNSRLRLDRISAGSRLNLASLNLAARVVNGTSYWVRGRFEGNDVSREFFTSAPTPTVAPTNAGTTTLAGADATQFGSAVSGKPGLSWIPQHAAATVDDFTLDGFVRRLATLPTEISFNGAIPGDAPALGTIGVSIPTGASAVLWGLLAWSPRSGASTPFGIIEAESAVSTTLWAVTADANYRGGSGLKATTSGLDHIAATFSLDSTGVVQDDYRGDEIDMEVWARVELASTLSSPGLQVVAYAPSVASGFPNYTAEYGLSSKPLVKPSAGTVFRFVRLGIVSVPVGAPFQLQITATTLGGSSGQFGLDYLVLCYASARALSPTGKTSIPAFLSFDGSTKLVQPDLSSRIRIGSSRVDNRDASIGGSLIELPPGQIDLLAKLSSLIPDNPNSDASNETLSHTATVQMGVTPRWRLARSS